MRRKGGLCAAFCLSLSDGVDDSSAFGYRIHVNSHVYSVNGPDLASWSRESNLSLASFSIYVHCVATDTMQRDFAPLVDSRRPLRTNPLATDSSLGREYRSVPSKSAICPCSLLTFVDGQVSFLWYSKQIKLSNLSPDDIH
jgi:hypothetical protein